MSDDNRTVEAVFSPNDLDSHAAQIVVEKTTMGRTRTETDAQFVKRIVAAYLNAAAAIARGQHLR